MPGVTEQGIRAQFIDAMSHAACSVNIVTTDGPAGRHGVTVSAMASVSADSTSPSLLVCVHHLSKTCAAIQQNGVFCVNLLRDDQSPISDVFAGRTKSEHGDKFAVAQWATQQTGAPRIVDPLVAFDCTLKSNLRYGSHHIFIGEVADVFIEKAGNPLIYANRAYGTPAKLLPAPIAARDDAPRTLRLGALVTLAPYVVPALVERYLAAHPNMNVQLVEAAQTGLLAALRNGECDVALTYGFDLEPDFTAEHLTEIPAYVLLPEGHPLASVGKIAIAALAEEPMILLDLPMSRDYFLQLFRSKGYEPRVRLRSSNFETVRGLVGHGLGFALLGTKPSNNMTYDGLAVVARPLADGGPGSPIVIASRSRAHTNPTADAFKSVCRDYFH